MLASIARWFERKALTPQTAWHLLAGGHSTASSISVSPQTALKCPAVRGAVAVLSESVSQLPLILYRRGDDGSKERATAHPLYSLLHDQPNDWSSSYEFRLGMMTALILHGNAFAFINRSRATGQVVELIQIDSTAVEIEANDAQEPTYFVTDASGVRREIDRIDLLHIRCLGPDPHRGESPLLLVKEAIALAVAMERHAGHLFGSGARPSGVLEVKGRLSPDAQSNLRRSFQERFGGPEGTGKTLVLEEGISFKPTQYTSVDLQFLELRRFQIAEIARALRIPLHLLGDWERATWSNAEVAGQQFLSHTLLPWLKLWEGALRRALLTPEERRDHYFEFMVDDLVRADISARFEAYAKAVTNGLLSINEVRAMENRPPMAGGDELRVPLNTAPADQEEPV